VVCVLVPRDLHSVGAWYEDFEQTTDAEVRTLLAPSRAATANLEIMDAHALTGAATDYDALVMRAAGRRFVLVGEASHGTHEFYRERAEITKRLIAEAGVTVVAVEADWPDAYRVNRYVRGETDDRDAREALSGFTRFPVWMWRNTEVAEFVTWLREWNDALPQDAPKVGFYGLDLYSLHASMAAVIEYLERVDPGAARRARERYACFDHFSRDPQVYGYDAQVRGAEPCERQAVEELLELQRQTAEIAARDGRGAEDGHFYAEQNARIVVDAERYYRAMFRGGSESWNLRDTHMADTLDALVAHLERTRGHARTVVWEHNSHVGDARATELGSGGQVTVGQLARERHGSDVLLVGLTTYTGTVTAASDWGGDAERKRVRPALEGSWEALFHEQHAGRFLLDLGASDLRARRLQRAIGVVYRPETERHSHYLHARLRDQFDMILHIDETRALEPLERTSLWEAGELPETYPWGT
jgi:erythromycin esterase-like protein